MSELTDKYKALLLYPEFNEEDIKKRYTKFVKGDKVSGDGYFEEPSFTFNVDIAFNYIVLMYAPESELSQIDDINVRKEKAMKMTGVPKDKQASILNNDNPMISDMITRLFRTTNSFDYELLESGREAVAILLDVVRTPISKELEDDKARNAAKAKRECYEDATFIIKEIKKLQKELYDKGSEDVADNVSKSAFKVGFAEGLANRSRKS